MNRNLKMILFVIILGSITSLLLVGMDMLTADRIEQNKEAQIKAVILNVNDIDFNYSNIHNKFEESIIIYTYEDKTFYLDPITNQVSFIFIGSGLWGDIRGIITLDESFEVIVGITILAQQETPGLGGIVAEEKYLRTFKDIRFIDDEIEIIRRDNTPNEPNQVDAIAGATGTSNAFQKILNDQYAAYKIIWENRPLEDIL